MVREILRDEQPALVVEARVTKVPLQLALDLRLLAGIGDVFVNRPQAAGDTLIRHHLDDRQLALLIERRHQVQVLTRLRPPGGHDVDLILRVRLVRVGALILLEWIVHLGADYRVNPINLHFGTHYSQGESEGTLRKVFNPSFSMSYGTFCGIIL